VRRPWAASDRHDLRCLQRRNATSWVIPWIDDCRLPQSSVIKREIALRDPSHATDTHSSPAHPAQRYRSSTREIAACEAERTAVHDQILATGRGGARRRKNVGPGRPAGRRQTVESRGSGARPRGGTPPRRREIARGSGSSRGRRPTGDKAVGRFVESRRALPGHRRRRPSSLTAQSPGRPPGARTSAAAR
jgi:hypothetical protein